MSKCYRLTICLCCLLALGAAACGPDPAGETVGPQGGTLHIDPQRFPELAGTTLEIPAGALSRDTTIRMSRGGELVRTGQPVSASLQLEPDGLTFLKPVVLTLPYHSGDVPAGWMVSLLVTSGGTEQPELPQPLLQLDPTSGTVAASIEHFSQYQLMVQEWPAPELQVIAPLRGPNHTDFQISLIGRYWHPESKVTVNGIAATRVALDSRGLYDDITYGPAPQYAEMHTGVKRYIGLLVDVPAQPTVQGLVPVMVENPNGKQVVRSDLFTYYRPPVMAAEVVPPAPSATGDIRVADFTGDGIPDVAVTTATGSPAQYAIAVYRGMGNGSFAAIGTPTITGMQQPFYSKSGDYDQDGKLDILVGYDSGTPLRLDYRLWKGDGSGGFQELTGARNLPKEAPFSTVGDFDQDGKLDLVRTLRMTSQIEVYRGDGTGAFTLVFTGTTGTGPQPYPAVGDVDGDGKLDLLTANNGGAGGGDLSLFLGNGDGTFQAATSIPLGDVSEQLRASMVFLVDLNRDGKKDIVTRCYNAMGLASPLKTMLNQGSGTFVIDQVYSEAIALTANLPPTDLNGDQIPDLVVIDMGGSNELAGLRLNDGNGQFGAMQYLSTKYSLLNFSYLADMDGDGRPEIILLDNSRLITLFHTFI